MKNSVKKIFLLLTAVIILCALCVGVFSAGAENDDPAYSYVPEIAENEDSTLDLWFEHSFKKVLTHDTTPSDMDTYSVYMAKNEIVLLFNGKEKIKVGPKSLISQKVVPPKKKKKKKKQ